MADRFRAASATSPEEDEGGHELPHVGDELLRELAPAQDLRLGGRFRLAWAASACVRLEPAASSTSDLGDGADLVVPVGVGHVLPEGCRGRGRP